MKNNTSPVGDNHGSSQSSLRFKRRGLKEKKQAFTLVELIVVITILAILWTIAFLSFQWYSRDARDSVRIADLSNIHKQLELMLVKAWNVYMPENKVDITASGIVILYQWEMWQDTLNKLKVNNWWLDPVDQTPYTYSTTKNLKQYELMWFLENWNKVAAIFPQANAAINLTNRFPTTKWDSIWIILDPTTNIPIQSTWTWVDIVNTNILHKIYLDNSSSWSISWTWNTLFTKLYNKSPELLKDKNLAQLDSSLVLYFDMETTTLTWWYIKLKDLSRYHNDWICSTFWWYIDCWSYNWPQFKNIDWRKYMNFRNYDLLPYHHHEDFIFSKNSTSLNITNNEVTISMWYRLDKNRSDMLDLYPKLLAKNDYNWWYQAHIDWYYNTLNMGYISSTSWVYIYSLDTNVLKPNTWYFYTWVKTKNWLYLYNNWKLINSISITKQMWLSNKNLYIWYGFEWDIDEVRVYDRALSAEEVMSLYNSSK